MKSFAVFAAVLALACADPSAWTLSMVSDAIDNPITSAELKPALVQALDLFMYAVYNGQMEGPIRIRTPAGIGATYSLSQIDAALHHAITTDSIFTPYIEAALNKIMEALYAGEEMKTVDVQIPSFELSYWSLHEIDAALSDPATNPILIPYLERALNKIMSDLVSGGSHTEVVVAVPYFPVTSPVILPAPAVEEPESIIATPVVILPEAPLAPEPVIAPEPVVAAPVPSSPLVQIIVNVREAQAPQPAVPVVVEPVVEEPIEVQPIDVIAVLPPAPVEAEPIDVIAVQPLPVNPIDVIAVQPVPIVNPIDAIAHPVEALAPEAVVVTGPLV